jgi:hypothetical protein
VNTIAVDGTFNPVNYTVTEEDTAETVTLQNVSEYSNQLLGDPSILFTESNEALNRRTAFSAQAYKQNTLNL